MRLRTWLVVVLLLAASGVILSILAAHPLSPSLSSENTATTTVTESGKREVLLFFPNTTLAGSMSSCGEVFPVQRILDDTQSISKLAIEAILAGPTAEERKLGYTTALASDAKIQSILADEGDVALDFNPAAIPTESQCTMTTARAQITATLRQLAVRNVFITANGVAALKAQQ